MEAIYVIAIAMYVIMGIITFGIKLELSNDEDSILMVFTVGLVVVIVTWPYLLGMLIGSWAGNVIALLVSINLKLK